jgi:hypothetical protein
VIAAMIFTWYLLTTPSDKLICSMWISTPPTREQVIAACGTADLTPYRLDVRSGGDTVCSLPAGSLFWVQEDCRLPAALDQYSLLVIEPNHSELICTVMTEHEGQPSAEEVRQQCRPAALTAFNAGQLQARLVKSEPQSANEPFQACRMPHVEMGLGLYQTPAAASMLATAEPYALLGGRLIWWGYVRPACGTFSGLDPYTLAANPCGMISAQPKVTEWQNQFDAEIWSAATAQGVPAVLLKRMIGIESQFWPLWTPPAGEVGIGQVTDDGLDILLRYDAQLAAQVCQQVMSGCSKGYPQLTTRQKSAVRDLLARQLSCAHCGPTQAVDATRADVEIYARLLRAFYCYAGEIASPSWENAMALYHAGPACVSPSICPAGQEYFRRLQ